MDQQKFLQLLQSIQTRKLPQMSLFTLFIPPPSKHCGATLNVLQWTNIYLADTGVVKAATAELKKTYYPNPQSLLWLLHILTSHDDQYVPTPSPHLINH